MPELKVGDKAPYFEGVMADGQTVSLKDYVGKQNLVLYFYPKDNTPGCTREACSFRDNMARITGIGTAVVGVSVDSLKSHENFAAKYGLNFPLLTDKDRAIVTAYGAGIIGKLTAKRTTYLIDKSGVVRYIWRQVSIAGHVDGIIAKIGELGL